LFEEFFGCVSVYSGKEGEATGEAFKAESKQSRKYETRSEWKLKKLEHIADLLHGRTMTFCVVRGGSGTGFLLNKDLPDFFTYVEESKPN
jgi:hypothetical protein